MRLLIEEAISQELTEPEKRVTPTGQVYDHYAVKYDNSQYCAVTIIRAGDSMINEIFELIPGISVGKILI